MEEFTSCGYILSPISDIPIVTSVSSKARRILEGVFGRHSLAMRSSGF